MYFSHIKHLLTHETHVILYMFVVKSYINNWNEKITQLIDSFADDEIFHVVFITGHKKMSENADSDVHAVRRD